MLNRGQVYVQLIIPSGFSRQAYVMLLLLSYSFFLSFFLSLFLSFFISFFFF